MSSLPIDVESRRQLFIDDRFVADAHEIEWVLHRPKVLCESLLEPLKPWEQGRAGAWSSIMVYQGQFHYWYDAYNWDHNSHHIDHKSHAYCYAISQDGIHFDKPAEGLFRIDHHNDTNACMRSIEGGPVFLDNQATDDKRFRFIGRWNPARGRTWNELAGIGERDTWMFSSPDGLHWIRSSKPFIRRWLGATQSVVFDNRLKSWVLFLRAHLPMSSGFTRRAIMRVVVDQLDTELTLPPSVDGNSNAALENEWPVVLDVDDLDPPGSQMYVGNIFKYDRADDIFLGFVPVWHDRRSESNASDQVQVQLALSRNGIDWQRPWRMPLFTPQLQNGNIPGQVFPVQNPVVVGRELWLYFNAMEELHMDKVHVKGNCMLARAIWPLNRFVKLEPQQHTAEFRTPLLRFLGNRLLVDADCNDGELRVGIDSETGKPLSGFSMNDCTLVASNDHDVEVRWRSKRGLSTLQGKPIRLRFKLTGCSTYGFQFTP